jgi:DNA polymerase-2
MTRGFLLTRQWRERDEQQDLVFWIATGNGPVKLTFPDEESVFFVPTNSLGGVKNIVGNNVRWRAAPVSLKDFAHEDVTACYFASQKGLNIARSRLEQSGIHVLEGDIRPTDRYLMERFVTGPIEVAGEIDWQSGYGTCTSPRVSTCDYMPELKVVSLDIETSWTDQVLFSIAIAGEGIEKVFMIGERDESAQAYVEFVADETILLTRFLDWFGRIDPDVIIGWSVVAFDLNFLQKRCDALGVEFTLGRANESVRWRSASRGNQERLFALVPGRLVFDGIELLRTATYTFESFSLENVARSLLGRGKLVHDVDARAAEIQNMFYNDKRALAEYNLEDCVLVLEIFDATNLIQFALERARLTGLDADRAGGSVAAFDYLYLPRLHRKGFVAPVVVDESGVGSPGGFVLDSKPGLYDHVIVLDFKSLYPSIIRTFLVDPLAMIVAEREDDPVPGFREGRFSRLSYILPDIIEELWAARDSAKREGNAAMSQAIKIIMNSFYGVLGTPGCRFFDPRLVSSITMRGHEILKQTRDLIEARGLTVIYGDTDSVFVLLNDVKSKEESDEIGNELTEFLNNWWRDHIMETLSLQSCLEVEYETHFDRFLMPTVRGSEKGSKKRYAGLSIENGESVMTFKGLETVRSDWSQLAREFQRDLYRRIFLGEPYEEFVRETVEKVQVGELDEKLVLRRRLRRKLSDYEKNVPPHVRAARRAEEIRRARGLAPRFDGGGWVEYVMTVNGPEPFSYAESTLDYQFYIDRQLAPIADAILSFESTSLAQLTDKQMGLF